MAITPHIEPLPDGRSASAAVPSDELSAELLFQQELARRRAEEGEGSRLRAEETLLRPDGLVQANELSRVAKRVDRVTRYLTGEDPMHSVGDAAEPSALVQRSLKRVEGLPTALAEDVRPAVEQPNTRGVGAETGEGEVFGPVAEHLLERIVGTADFMSVRYLDLGVVAQQSVGRVNIRDQRGTLRGYGTGFLVSTSLLLTNHHVLPDAATARMSVIEFDYQDGFDGKPLLSNVLGFAPDRFFVANRELDFALVAVDGDAETLAKYGFCHLTAAQGTVLIGEPVTIVQHPRGEKKQVALRENKVLDIPELVVHYAADTEPGSSGSPVFNDQWEVVALHHASVATPQHAPTYAYLNEGIRISRILNFLAAAELSADQRALVDELTTVSSAHIAQSARRNTTSQQTETGPLTPSVQGDGTVTIDVPLRITVQLGSPAGATMTFQPTVAASVVPAEVVAGVEAVAIDPDYSNRSGYDADFLGFPLPLPEVGRWAEVASPELTYHHFSVVMNRARRLALYTAVNIDGRTASRPRRESDRWFIDPRLPRDEQTGEAVYRDNPLDRGHLVRRLDPAWGAVAEAANDDTFHFTNAIPQHHSFNAGSTLWLGLEDYILNNADNRDMAISVVSGPVLRDDDPVYRGVALPREFFKVVATVTATGAPSVTGYLLSQEALLDEFAAGPEEFSFGAYRTFQVPVARIAELTGLGLAPYVAGDPLGRLEAHGLPREIIRGGDIVLST